MKKKVLFIVNPISGGRDKAIIPSLIDKNLDHRLFDAEIIFSEFIGHATELANKALIDDFDIIAAVGGDGTINEIASVMESSGKTMAIIPCGSGNGLARTLKIPLDNGKAISIINNYKTTKIDVGHLNEKKFFNMAGVGFDAHISEHFARDVKRGFGGYIKSTLNEITDYKAKTYEIEIDGKSFEKDAFMISIANSSQYGNSAHISPMASVNDGLLDLCIVKPFPIYSIPILGYRMFTKSLHESKFLEIIRGKRIIIKNFIGPAHIDGEPINIEGNIDISIVHLALELIV